MIRNILTALRDCPLYTTPDTTPETTLVLVQAVSA